MQLRRWPEGTGEAQWAGAQNLGRITARYALYPHAGGWQDGKLWQAYRDFSRPLICSEMVGAVRSGKGSLLAIDAADIEVACVKKAEREDGLVVRIWNPTAAAQDCKLALGIPFTSVVTTNLNEDPRPDASGALRIRGKRAVRVTVSARKIMTLLFRFRDGNK